MCLAVPMKVLEIKWDNDGLNMAEALVEAKGTTQRVRLDIVDKTPSKGDYVIVHAGFAIKTLTEDEAKESIQLLEKMAKNL